MNQNEVWTATLDEKYTITVERTKLHQATLTLRERTNSSPGKRRTDV